MIHQHHKHMLNYIYKELTNIILSNDKCSCLWLRNIDDMFVMTKYDKTETLNELNTFNSKIHFTHESAVNKTLPFLEC